MKYKLLSKLEIEKVGIIKNRVVMSAMTRSFANNDHSPNSEILRYYEKRAKNGV